MGTAYTPGLTVSEDTTIRRARRLPLKGEVVVQAGAAVEPRTVVARTLVPGVMRTVRAAEILGLEPDELSPALRIREGEEVQAGQLVGEMRSFFGLFRAECRAPTAGTVELISPTTGNVGIRVPPTAVEVQAYIRGTVADVQPGEGVVVETRGALVQGIFGVGGERQGVLRMVVPNPAEPLEEGMILPEHAGQLLVGGSHVTGAALRRASEVGAAGVIVGAIVDRDLIDFLGYDIGVAITGDEAINLTLVLTEGFGAIRMAARTFQLLQSLEGRQALINGATQIRAGVIRPEVIVPSESSGVRREASAEADLAEADAPPAHASRLTSDSSSLDVGTPIRIIREPCFGRLATVSALPPEPRPVPSGAVVRVLEAELEGGERVTVPRANVEIIAG